MIAPSCSAGRAEGRAAPARRALNPTLYRIDSASRPSPRAADSSGGSDACRAGRKGEVVPDLEASANSSETGQGYLAWS